MVRKERKRRKQKSFFDSFAFFASFADSSFGTYANCCRKRTSFSKNARRSVTP